MVANRPVLGQFLPNLDVKSKLVIQRSFIALQPAAHVRTEFVEPAVSPEPPQSAAASLADLAIPAVEKPQPQPPTLQEIGIMQLNSALPFATS